MAAAIRWYGAAIAACGVLAMMCGPRSISDNTTPAGKLASCRNAATSEQWRAGSAGIATGEIALTATAASAPTNNGETQTAIATVGTIRSPSQRCATTLSAAASVGAPNHQT